MNYLYIHALTNGIGIKDPIRAEYRSGGINLDTSAQ